MGRNKCSYDLLNILNDMFSSVKLQTEVFLKLSSVMALFLNFPHFENIANISHSHIMGRIHIMGVQYKMSHHLYLF